MICDERHDGGALALSGCADRRGHRARPVAVAASLVAFASFNFFFLPPVGTFAIANRDDLIALFVLLAVALIGSHLSYQARARAEETIALAAAAQCRRSGATAAPKPSSALVASFSHDLKTPFTALTVAAANLGDARTSDRERADRARPGELARLKRLFDNVVEMASVETRAVSAEVQWVQASDILEAARLRAAPALGERVVEVHDACADRLIRLIRD